jgi:hypothetical protein
MDFQLIIRLLPLKPENLAERKKEERGAKRDRSGAFEIEWSNAANLSTSISFSFPFKRLLLSSEVK